MKAKMIRIKGHSYSEASSNRCLEEYAKFNYPDIELFDAVTPDNVDEVMKGHGIGYDKGSFKGKPRIASKGTKTTASCAMSHFAMWLECAAGTEPMLILEHDAFPLRDLTKEVLDDFMESDFQWFNCRVPTRWTRPEISFKSMKNCENPAACTAYILKPKGAQDLVDSIFEKNMFYAPADGVALADNGFNWLCYYDGPDFIINQVEGMRNISTSNNVSAGR